MYLDTYQWKLFHFGTLFHMKFGRTRVGFPGSRNQKSSQMPWKTVANGFTFHQISIIPSCSSGFKAPKAISRSRLMLFRCFVELYSIASKSSFEYVLWKDRFGDSLLLQSATYSSPLSSITTCNENNLVSSLSCICFTKSN